MAERHCLDGLDDIIARLESVDNGLWQLELEAAEADRHSDDQYEMWHTRGSTSVDELRQMIAHTPYAVPGPADSFQSPGHEWRDEELSNRNLRSIVFNTETAEEPAQASKGKKSVASTLGTMELTEGQGAAVRLKGWLHVAMQGRPGLSRKQEKIPGPHEQRSWGSRDPLSASRSPEPAEPKSTRHAKRQLESPHARSSLSGLAAVIAQSSARPKGSPVPNQKQARRLSVQSSMPAVASASPASALKGSPAARKKMPSSGESPSKPNKDKVLSPDRNRLGHYLRSVRGAVSSGSVDSDSDEQISLFSTRSSTRKKRGLKVSMPSADPWHGSRSPARQVPASDSAQRSPSSTSVSSVLSSHSTYRDTSRTPTLPQVKMASSVGSLASPAPGKRMSVTSLQSSYSADDLADLRDWRKSENRDDDILEPALPVRRKAGSYHV